MKTFPSSVPFTILLIALLTALPAALPAAPYLVKDLNTAPSTEAQVFLAGIESGQGVSYFAGGDPAHGVELWRPDGTPGGTERLTDICAGRCDGLPPYYLPSDGRTVWGPHRGLTGRKKERVIRQSQSWRSGFRTQRKPNPPAGP